MLPGFFVVPQWGWGLAPIYFSPGVCIERRRINASCCEEMRK